MIKINSNNKHIVTWYSVSRLDAVWTSHQGTSTWRESEGQTTLLQAPKGRQKRDYYSKIYTYLTVNGSENMAS